MIRLEKVTKLYGTILAVDNFSVDIEAGKVCVLIGPSGSGKTTLLKMINRLIEPTSGRIFIDDKDTSRIKPELLRRSIGYAIQNVGLFPHMTVGQNIAVVPELVHWDKPRISKRVVELLQLVGLEPAEYMSKYPHELSGGEAQRIGVARALAADPPILLMDEPFGAVDPLTRAKLQTQFEHIQKELKKTVVLVTHDLDEAIRLADRIALMRSGRLIQYDSPDVILAKPADKFVHDFVGTDRALKRLSRINVGRYIKPAPSISVNASTQEALSTMNKLSSIWVVNENNQLVGWAARSRLIESNSIREALVLTDLNDIALTGDATLRQALSVMLGQGVHNIPVIDENKKFIGELSLAEVEAATVEKEDNSYVYPKP
jgi:osmoprotectant transport system ATP-binding protein